MVLLILENIILSTPATEFISRPVTLTNGSSPFSKASLN